MILPEYDFIEPTQRADKFKTQIAQVLQIDPLILEMTSSGAIPLNYFDRGLVVNPQSFIQHAEMGTVLRSWVDNDIEVAEVDKAHRTTGHVIPNMSLFNIHVIDIRSGTRTKSCDEFRFVILTHPAQAEDYLRRMNEWEVAKQKRLPLRNFVASVK